MSADKPVKVRSKSDWGEAIAACLFMVLVIYLALFEPEHLSGWRGFAALAMFIAAGAALFRVFARRPAEKPAGTPQDPKQS